MEALPFIYLFGIILLADIVGSFRRIGKFWSFIILIVATPIIGLPIILLSPRLPKSICLQDYMSFHAGITYRFRKRVWKGKVYYIMVNDVDIVLNSFEFTEFFAPVQTRKEYLRKKKIFNNEEIHF